MIALELPASTAEEVSRAVRALGSHRYVAGRLHLVHAFVWEAIAPAGEAPSRLEEAIRWSAAVLSDADIDPDSRDERLWRPASEEEIGLAIEAFWRPGARADAIHENLINRLLQSGLDLSLSLPFDEREEEQMHPVLIDAGWELLPLAALDPERHKGVIQSFGEAIDFDVARFEEESAYERPAYLQELAAVGPVELLRGVDGDGRLVEPFVLWAEGNETYHEYVVRGVIRAAKLTPTEANPPG